MAQNSYTRQSSFSNGDVIDASLFNAEFDQLTLAFSETVGHTHNGDVGQGSLISLIGETTGVTNITVDDLDPLNHKITFTLDGTDLILLDEDDGVTFIGGLPHDQISGLDSANFTHDSQNMFTFLDALETGVGDAGADAAAAAASAAAAAIDADDAMVSADAAAASAALLGVPTYVADGGTHILDNADVGDNLVFEGDGTLTLPTVLVKGRRFVIRFSFKAISTKLVSIPTPNFNIIGKGATVLAGDTLTLSPGQYLTLEAISTSELEIKA